MCNNAACVRGVEQRTEKHGAEPEKRVEEEESRSAEAVPIGVGHVSKRGEVDRRHGKTVDDHKRRLVPASQATTRQRRGDEWAGVRTLPRIG
jgi:hypothetical protein